jgi:hypothetical protein
LALIFADSAGLCKAFSRRFLHVRRVTCGALA